MQHEALAVLARQCVDHLGVTIGAQRGGHQGLSLATGEQCRAVGARQHAVADLDRAHGAGVATVDAGLTGQDLAAHDAGLDLEQQAVDFDAVEAQALFGQCSLDSGVGLAASLGAGLLGADLISSAQLRLGQFGHLGDEGLILGRCLPVPDRLAGVTHQLVDGVDRHLALVMTEHHGAQHHVFGQLVGLGFHHQHGSFGARHDQIQLGVGQLGLARVQHVFAIDITHAGCADRAVERDAGDGQRGRGGDHGGDVGLHLGVQAQHVNHHLHFIEEAFREQRADGTVDQTAGQGLQLAGAAFTLEEAARDLAGGIGLLDVVDRQREEVLARLGLGLGHHGGQHHGVFDVDDHGTAGLAGDLAGFHGDLMLAPLEGLGDFVEHAHGCLR